MATKRKPALAVPLEARWRRLDAQSQLVLAAAVLHEGALSDGSLAEIAARPEAVDAVVGAGWLREERPGWWSLDPAVDRGALRPLVPWSQRRAAHLVLGRLLQREREHWAAAAVHLAAAGRRDEAGRLWLAAAREQCRRQDHGLAADYFSQAIEHLPSESSDGELVDAVRDFGTCAALQRDTVRALELIRRWREAPGLAGRAAFQAEAARVHASLLARAQRHVEAAHLRRQAAEWFEQAGAPAEVAAELVAAATTLAYALHLTLAEESAARAFEKARVAGCTDLQAEAAIIRGFCLGMRGDSAAGRAQLETALDLALGASLTAQAADAYRVLGNVREYASCYHDVPDAFAQALSYCRRHGETYIADLCVGCLSYSLFRAGNWRKSAALARQVLSSKRTPLGSRCVARWVMGVVQAHRGELKPALRNLAWSLDASRQLGVAGMELLCLASEALAHEFAGENEAAAGTYRRLMELWLTTEDRHDAVPGLTGAVIFFATHGDGTAAREFAAALQRIATANPNPENVGGAAVAAAELKLLDGKPREAADTFAEAIRAYEQRGLTLEILRVRLRQAAAWQAGGEHARACALLRETRLRAARLGARPLAAQAAAMLEASRSRDGSEASDASDPWDTLSPRQREVARHLSAGRTNKEIARALALSVRTVDMHVAHVLARLDCRTRTAAAARLAALLER